MKTRYVATIDFYILEDTAEKAMDEALEITKYLKDTYDNKASIVSLVRNDFGKLNK